MKKTATHKSHGWKHHVSSTQECPHGHRFRTGTTVVKRPDGRIGVSFKSKQTGRWGWIVVSADEVHWRDTWPPWASDDDPTERAVRH